MNEDASREFSEGRGSSKRGKPKGRKAKQSKHHRVQSCSAAWSNSVGEFTDQPSAYSVWIPGVGYVMDPLGTFAAAASLQAQAHDLHMPRVASVDSQLSEGKGGPGDAKDARRRRRREEQRRNRSRQNKDSDTCSNASTSHSLVDETSSLPSSSPTLSYSSPSSSVSPSVRHSRKGSNICQLGTLSSSLPPEVLADLLSIATWKCLVRRVETVCTLRLLVMACGDSKKKSASDSCSTFNCGWFSFMFSPRSSRKSKKALAPPPSPDRKHSPQEACEEVDSKNIGIFSRPNTPSRVRRNNSVETQSAQLAPTAGATVAYILGRKALEKENHDIAARAIQAGCRGHSVRKRTETQLKNCACLQGMARGILARRGVAALQGAAMWGDEEVLLAILRYMAEEEDIYKVLMNQLDCHADFIFPDRKRRGAGSLRAVVAGCVTKGLVTCGGQDPKFWVSISEEVDMQALPTAPPPPSNELHDECAIESEQLV